MESNPSPDQFISQLLPEEFRKFIEDSYYSQVTEQAILEHVMDSREFLEDPIHHIALYSDHGVVHVRDVAREIILVLDRIHGVLIPPREKRRRDFMYGYGAIISYLHDIGMKNFSPFGRFMHPEFAAQAVFNKEFEEYVNMIWDENAGNLSWRLLSLSSRNLLKQDPRQVLRELMALSICHSKSKVPIEILNHPKALRELMQKVLSTDLYYLYLQQQVTKAEVGLTKSLDKEFSTFDPIKAKAVFEKKQETLKQYEETAKAEERGNSTIRKYYQNFEEESYLWLLEENEEVKALLADSIDSLRALRCADALRQRGTAFRTSAGYEVFVDQRSANAIYALRDQKNSQLYLFEANKPMNAGEANLASSELDATCNLRVSFHRGLFEDEGAIRKAGRNAAIVIHDIQADVIQSFNGVGAYHSAADMEGIKKVEEINILIEGVDDNHAFAGIVKEELELINEETANRSRAVVSLQNADLDEVNRYLMADPLLEHVGSEDAIQHMLDQIALSGHRVDELDRVNAFQEVKVACIPAGEALIRRGSPSGFVYIPFQEGLRVFPVGGYTSVPSSAWVPIGNTGVIRGSIRNAEVIAEQEVKMLVIPRQVYLQHWYQTYDAHELAEALKAVKNRMKETRSWLE